MPSTRVQSRRKMSRQARFRAALALARITAEAWATEQGVTGGHLSKVVNGERESASLLAKVDAFIAKQLGEPVPSTDAA